MTKTYQISSALFWGIVVFVLFAIGCSKNGSNNDGGITPDAFDPANCPGGVDKSTSIATAVELAAEEITTGYICPRNDYDFYKITVPSAENLLRINLQHTAPITNVNLTYLIMKEDETVVSTAPTNKNNQFNALHCLEAGTYYLLIQDQGNDAYDGKSPYQLNYKTEADKDQNEPNNDQSAATSFNNSATGYISCTGDLDFYKITVDADELVRVKLSNAKATVVDLKYTIYREDGSGNLELIATDSVDDGSKETANLDTTYHVSNTGTYYVVVEDTNGDDSDADNAYTIEITTPQEPDNNDKKTRNDHPTNATTLGTFSETQTQWQSTGRIASLADVDYFKINASTSSPIAPNNAAVIEISLSFDKSTDVDLSVAFLNGDSDSPCTDDSCCKILAKNDCPKGTAFQCDDSSFVCIAKGEQYCATCETSPTSSCAQEKFCAGSVTCLKEGVCGFQQFTRYANNGASIRTAQPVIHAQPWYIRVSDLKGDEYDNGATYTLTVKMSMEPDNAKEPNNKYFPRLITFPTAIPQRDSDEFTDDDVQDFFESGNNLASPGVTIPLPTTPGSIGTWSDWISGYLSYEHDEDWYKITNPCTDASAQGTVCLIQAEFNTTGTCPTAAQGLGSGLEFVYLIYKGSDLDGFPSANTLPKQGTFGDDGSKNQCNMLIRNNSDLNLVVSDRFHNNWSWTCQYQIRFRVTHKGTCPIPPCVTAPNGNCAVN